MTGCLAKSKAGHDEGKIYLIISEDEEYVYLSDGKYKPIEEPKKKKKKHIQIIKKKQDEDLTNRLLSGKPVSNEEIKRQIKVWNSYCKNTDVNI